MLLSKQLGTVGLYKSMKQVLSLQVADRQPFKAVSQKENEFTMPKADLKVKLVRMTTN